MSLVPRSYKPAVLAVSSLAAVALAACGSTATPSDERKPESVLTLLASDVKGSLQKTVDTTTKANSVTMKMAGKAGGEAVNGQGALLLGTPLKAELTIEDPADGPQKLRIIDGVLYIEIPEAERADMNGKRWLKMDFSSINAWRPDSFSDQLNDMDPVKQVKMLLAAESATVVGEEQVDGVPTVHYTVTMPVASYLDNLEAKLRAGVEKQMTKQGVKEVKVDAWVDEKYQPRKVRMVAGDLSDLTVSYTDYGKAVTIEVPPTAETLDFAEMLKSLGGLKPEDLPIGG